MTKEHGGQDKAEGVSKGKREKERERERERERDMQGDRVLFSSVGLWEGFLGVKITWSACFFRVSESLMHARSWAVASGDYTVLGTRLVSCRWNSKKPK